MNNRNKKIFLFLIVITVLLLSLTITSAVNSTEIGLNKTSENVKVSKNTIKNNSNIKSAEYKTKTKLTISNVKKQYEYKDSMQIKVKLTDKDNKAIKNQKLKVNLNKNSYTLKTNNQGIAVTKNITLYTVGKYKILVKYDGNSKYQACNNTKNTKTIKMGLKIVSNEQSLEYSKKDKSNISFSLKNKDNVNIQKTGTVNLTVNNKVKKVKMTKGIINLNLQNSKLNGIKLNNGKNNITLSYAGDKYTKPIIQKNNIILNRSHTNISLNVPNLLGYYSINTIYPEINIEQPQGQKIYYIIDNKKYKATTDTYDQYGIIINFSEPVTYTAKEIGTHTIYAKFTGDKNYAPAKTQTYTFKVIYDYPILKLDIKEKNNVNETMYIRADIDYLLGSKIYETDNKINFTINNKTYQRNYSIAGTILKYKPTKEGVYNIDVKLDDKNTRIKHINKTFTVGKNIVKKKTRFDIDYYSKIVRGNNQTINAVLRYQPNQYLDEWDEVKGAKVIVGIDGINKTLKTDINGKIRVFTDASKVSFKYMGTKSNLKESVTLKIDKMEHETFYASVEYLQADLFFDESAPSSLVPGNNSYESIYNLLKNHKTNMSIHMYFRSNNSFLELNRGNVDIYLDNHYFKTMKVKNNEANLKLTFSLLKDIEKNNYKYISYVYNNNKDVSNFTIKHLIKSNKYQEMEKPFTTKYPL